MILVPLRILPSLTLKALFFLLIGVQLPNRTLGESYSFDHGLVEIINEYAFLKGLAGFTHRAGKRGVKVEETFGGE